MHRPYLVHLHSSDSPQYRQVVPVCSAPLSECKRQLPNPSPIRRGLSDLPVRLASRQQLGFNAFSSMRGALLGVMGAALLFGGCASKPTISAAPTRMVVIPQYYTVKPGDTLSKIAARYNLNYQDIARLNNINSDYVIYVNQSLRLHHGGKDAPRILVKATPDAVPLQARTMPVQSGVQTRNATGQPRVPASAPRGPATTSSSQASSSQASSSQASIRQSSPALARATAPVGVAAGVAVAPVLPNTPTVLPTGLNWQWPATGPILAQFDLARDIKGLRISGTTGSPIRAAADGEVVYASDRLVEYGNLVLVRHIKGYVTAYAHNSTIVVKEGDKVTAGQKIAEMGSSGTKQTMLEFQIRLNGKPVNPVALLPAQ